MSSRQVQIGIALAGVIVFAVVVYFFGLPQKPQSPFSATAPEGAIPSATRPATGDGAKTAEMPKPAAPPAAPAARPPEPAKADEAPVAAFDVVRVEPSGETVIAGRAAPGATVELLRDGKQYDRVVADASGLFVMTPQPLPPGSHDLTLRFTSPDGKQGLSKQSVTVVVAADRKQRPMVALTAPDAPTVVLSKPDEVKTASATPAAAPAGESAGATPPQTPAAGQGGGQGAGVPTALAIETVEAEERGRLFVSGRAAPGATVRLYLNDSYLASGVVAPEGRVSFTIGSGVAPGDYRVRLDHVDPVSGQVRSRAEVAFTMTGPAVASVSGAPAAAGKADGSAAGRPAGAAATQASDPSNVLVPEVKTAIVMRGDSLWRISRRTYGSGVRYTVIYTANQEQIRNPDLIYPGQVFVLPGENQRTGEIRQ